MLHNHKRKSKAENKKLSLGNTAQSEGKATAGLPFFEIWAAPFPSRLFFV